jgi:hypothetical protein
MLRVGDQLGRVRSPAARVRVPPRWGARQHRERDDSTLDGRRQELAGTTSSAASGDGLDAALRTLALPPTGRSCWFGDVGWPATYVLSRSVAQGLSHFLRAEVKAPLPMAMAAP